MRFAVMRNSVPPVPPSVVDSASLPGFSSVDSKIMVCSVSSPSFENGMIIVVNTFDV